MDDTLIREFRNKINEENYGLLIYRKFEDKNKWGILCSAMDWIEVTIAGIDVELLSRDNTNDASIKMITFLSCIGTMCEAISQLHRVLVTPRNIPFANDNSVFGKKISDNEYFKTIRACFAAHQINLNRVFTDDDPNERWFASWSGGTFSKNDFSVILYSNIPEKKSRFFDIQFLQLMQYAEKRYQYLNNLMDQFDVIVNDYKDGFVKQPIDVKDNIFDRLDILIEENEKRYRNYYYEYELKSIRMLYEVHFDDDSMEDNLVEKYRELYLPEVNEIQNNLQNMIKDELQLAVDEMIPFECHYAFSKLSDAVWGVERANSMLNWIISNLNSYVKPIVTLSDEMSLVEIYVLFKAACYHMKNSTEKKN